MIPWVSSTLLWMHHLVLGVQYFFFFFNVWLCWVFTAARTFSSGGEWGLLFIAVLGLLTVVASLVTEHRL